MGFEEWKGAREREGKNVETGCQRRRVSLLLPPPHRWPPSITTSEHTAGDWRVAKSDFSSNRGSVDGALTAAATERGTGWLGGDDVQEVEVGMQSCKWCSAGRGVGGGGCWLAAALSFALAGWAPTPRGISKVPVHPVQNYASAVPRRSSPFFSPSSRQDAHLQDLGRSGSPAVCL